VSGTRRGGGLVGEKTSSRNGRFWKREKEKAIEKEDPLLAKEGEKENLTLRTYHLRNE